MKDHDPVNHPSQYTDHPSGVECITVTEHMNFNVGNAVKYLWRAGLKGNAALDLEKAAWYIQREIIRIGGVPEPQTTAQVKDEMPLFAHIKDIDARGKAEVVMPRPRTAFDYMSPEEQEHYLKLQSNLEEMK